MQLDAATENSETHERPHIFVCKSSNEIVVA